jgi:hypothetical protein
MSSWQDDIDLKVIPLGINYHSFTSFGKNMKLNFGNIITEDDIRNTNGYGNTINDFNEKLKQELKNLVIEADTGDKKTIKAELGVKKTLLKKIALSIPAGIGYLSHALLYVPLQKLSWSKARHVDHYDSVLVGLLFILYPFYLLTITIITGILFNWYWAGLVFLLLPFCAWSLVQLKKQF